MVITSRDILRRQAGRNSRGKTVSWTTGVRNVSNQGQEEDRRGTSWKTQPDLTFCWFYPKLSQRQQSFRPSVNNCFNKLRQSVRATDEKCRSKITFVWRLHRNALYKQSLSSSSPLVQLDCSCEIMFSTVRAFVFFNK